MSERVLRDELPQNAYELLQTPSPNVVIATVDDNGYPRTAPFDLIYAPNTKTLYAGISPRHHTYQNIQRDGKVMVCVIDHGNIALGIRGHARTVKERMQSISIPVAIVEITILAVKSDALRWAPIIQGIRFQVTEEPRQRMLERAWNELSTFEVTKPIQ